MPSSETHRRLGDRPDSCLPPAPGGAGPSSTRAQPTRTPKYDHHGACTDYDYDHCANDNHCCAYDHYYYRTDHYNNRPHYHDHGTLELHHLGDRSRLYPVGD